MITDDVLLGFCLGSLGFGSMIFCSQGGPGITCTLYMTTTGFLFVLAAIKYCRERKNVIRAREIQGERQLFLEHCKDHARY